MPEEIKQNAAFRAAAEHLPLPVFHQPWWLDAVCGKDNWQVAMVNGKNGELLGLCAYFVKKIWGFRVILNPPFTPYLGVWLNPEFIPEKRVSRYNHETKIVRQLVDQLPAVLYHSLVHPPGFSSWLPFYWQGYRCSASYTFLFQPTSAGELYGIFQSIVRNRIKQAKASLQVVEAYDLRQFMRAFKNTLHRNNFFSKKEVEHFKRLSDSIFENKAGKILLATDHEMRPVAGIFLLEDAHTVYLWQMALDKAAPQNKGAMQLLISEALIQAGARGKVFNFEGSTLPHIERVYRAFGGERVPVYRLFKASNRLVYAAKELLMK